MFLKNIPIALGTNILQGEKGKKILKNAFLYGYRHIDTASYYNNINIIGPLINYSRKDFFLTSKLWTEEHGYENAKNCVFRELKKGNLNYIDQFLIHSPLGGKNIETFQALKDLQREKYIKNVGVSNFSIEQLELLREEGLVPSVNQIELNPYNQQKELVKYCKHNNIQVFGWSPLYKGGLVLQDVVLLELAKKYQKTIGQIIIKWIIMKNCGVVTLSTISERLIENLHIGDWILDYEDIEKINTLDIGEPCYKFEQDITSIQDF